MTKRVTQIDDNSNMRNNTTQQQFFLGVQTMNNSFDQIQSDSTSFENREAYEAQQEIETCCRCGQNEIDAWNVFDLCRDCFEACGE